MLKLYQIVMGLAAIVLAALCIEQQSSAPAAIPLAAPALSDLSPVLTIVNSDDRSAKATVEATEPESGDDASKAADVVGDLLTNRKHLDTIRSFSSPELDSLYAPLFRSLGLSPDDIDLFKDLVTARKIAQAELRIREQEAETDAALLDLQDQRTRAMAWFDQRMRDLLGPGHFDTVEGYDKSLAERTMLFDYKQGLDNVGRGLSYEQEDRLIRVMFAQRKQSPALDALFSAGASTFAGAGESDAVVREFNAWRDLVLLKCNGILNDEQLKALDVQLAAQGRALEGFFKKDID